MSGLLSAALVLATLSQPVARPEFITDPPAVRSPIQGVLTSITPPPEMPCVHWRIDDPASGSWWVFFSEADLSPFAGLYVTTWLNWAVGVPCGSYHGLVPYVSGVTPTAVASDSWGRMKSRYRNGPSN